MKAAGDDRHASSPPGGPGRVAGRRRLVVMAVVVSLVVAADQLTKSLAVSRLAGGPVHLFGPLRFQLSYNTGVAFSLGSGLTVPIVIVVVVLVALVAWFGRTVPSTGAAVAVGMILGGALGNLADRVFRGHRGAVVDFVYSGFWPTFNVADACIVCGCVALAVILWRSDAKRRRDRAGGELPS